MKRLIALALAAAVSLPVLAGDHDAGRHVERLKEELNLNDAQAAQVRTIMKEQHEKSRALWDQAAGDKEKVRSQMDALHKETMTRLGTVLDAGQMAKMQKLHEERMAKWKDRRDDREDFLDDLALNDDQKTQVKQILKEQHEKKRALFKDEGDRDAKRAQMDALHQETKTRLAAVLNEEQLGKFEAAHQEHMEKRKAWHEGRKDNDGDAKKEDAGTE